MPRTKEAGVPELGKRLESLMHEKGVDSSTLSGRTGISVSYLSRILRGEVVNPTIDFVVRLAAALGVTETDLVRQVASGPRRRGSALAGPPLRRSEPDEDTQMAAQEMTVGQALDAILDEEGLTLEDRHILGEKLIFPHARLAARLLRLQKGTPDEKTQE